MPIALEMDIIREILEADSIRKNPLYRAAKVGVTLGTYVAEKGAESRLRRIREQGAAGDLTSGFTQELLDYDLRAIRMGAQI